MFTPSADFFERKIMGDFCKEFSEDVLKYLKIIINVARHLRFYKDPCKKCLVKVTCNPMAEKCKQFHNHRRLHGYYENFLDETKEWTATLIVLGGVLFIPITFCFGLWKWVELLIS